MIRVVILGSGNVAEALGLALKQSGNAPVQIYSRNEERGLALADEIGCEYVTQVGEIASADLYIIAVSDRAIAEVSRLLIGRDGVVAHTGGGVGMDEITPQVANRGVLYPLQTFTKGRVIDLKEVPILIEGDSEKTYRVLEQVGAMLSGRVERIGSVSRAVLHVAAVFACNFTNYMYSIGADLAKGAGSDFTLLAPIIMETAKKAVASGDPATVQTGPAVRGDTVTQKRHEQILANRVEIDELYKKISEAIWETSKKR